MKLTNLEQDFLDFIRLCNNYNVKYLVIGGYAVAIYDMRLFESTF